MSMNLKDVWMLEKINSLSKESSLESSGRGIKIIRNYSSLLKDPSQIKIYQYKLMKAIQEHIMLINEELINSKNRPRNSNINVSIATELIDLVNSSLAVSNDRYSFIDIESLRNIKSLKNAVALKKPLVLKLKVKSNNDKYLFNIDIIESPKLVLTYATDKKIVKEENVERGYTGNITKMGKMLNSCINKPINNRSMSI